MTDRTLPTGSTLVHLPHHEQGATAHRIGAPSSPATTCGQNATTGSLLPARVRLVGLIAGARAAGDGTPRYTPPLTLTAAAVEAIYTSGPTTQIQVADGRDERTWHDVAVVLECEEEEEHDHAAKDCVVVLSDAWADGGAHLPADWDLSVRVMAEVTA